MELNEIDASTMFVNYNDILDMPGGVTVTFFIPNYNCGEFIKECINSIQKFPLDDIEIIVCDDGSTDNSIVVLQDMQSSDPRIRILQNDENRGVCFSRNKCILNARGKYVCSVDADDVIDAECYFEMYKIIEAETANLIIGNHVNFYNKSLPSKGLEKPVIHIYPCDQGIWAPPTSVGSFYNRLFIINSGVKFRANLLHGEDMTFNYELACRAEKVIHYDKICYFYRQHPNSTMHKKRSLEYCKKTYLTHWGMFQTFNNYKNFFMAEDPIKHAKKIKQLDMKLRSLKHTLIYTLAQVNDIKFFKKELLRLEQTHFYPFPLAWGVIEEDHNIIRKIIFFLLPIKFFAYAFHYIWRFSKRFHK